MSEIDLQQPSAHHNTNRSRAPVQEYLLRPDQDLTLEPATSGYNKLFVFLALVAFLALAFHSLPNVLSANRPRAGSAQSGLGQYQKDSSADQSSGADLDHTLMSTTKAPPHLSNHVLDHVEPTPSMDDKSVGENEIEFNQQDTQERIHNTEHTSPSQHTSSPSQHTRSLSQVLTSTKASPTPLSGQEQRQQQQQQQQQDQMQWTSLMGEVNLWSLVRASASLGFRIGLWFLQTMYQLARFIVAKPIEVVAALVERPYQITRDICKAFLPVYSFFTVAAVIGIVVGGSAIWIAQLLISAIGADERASQGVVLHNSSTSRYPRYEPRRAFEPRGNMNPAATDVHYASLNNIKFTVPQSHSNPGTGISQDAFINKRRGAMVEDENVDDEYQDDDDDEDDDWDHVSE